MRPSSRPGGTAGGRAVGAPRLPLSPVLSRHALDRRAERRSDVRALAAAWEDPRAEVVVLVERDGLWTTAVREPDGVPALAPAHPADVPPEGERYFLGQEDDGPPRWAVALPAGGRAAVPAGLRLAGLREVGATLPGRDAALLTTATGLAAWHRRHPRCPRCGGPTQVDEGGWVRRCEVDGSAHFPRTDPAVIMLCHDGGDRCLLGRAPAWPERRFSCLAGFVEPGESAEQAVVREVDEEVGLPVTAVEYLASQPWPFPASLMLGFLARVEPGEPHLRDGELAEARWLSRAELVRAAHDGSLRLPPPVSIAHRIVSGWAGEELPAAW